MKQYGLRYLYKNLGNVVKHLPFEITFHGKPIAVVTKPTKPSLPQSGKKSQAD